MCGFVVACGRPRAPAAPPSSPPPESVETAIPTDLSPNTLRDRRAEPGVRASPKPLAIGKARSVQCGKLTKRWAESSPTELLAGRLLVRAPSSAKIPEPLAGAPTLEEESRVVVEEDKLSLAIVARETFQLDPDLYEPEADAPTKPGSLDSEAAKFLKATFPSERGLEVAPVEIGTGDAKMRAYAARPRQPNAPPGQDTALVLALLVAQADGTLESVAFYVRGETVRNAVGSDLVGCTRLAERISSTIEPGPRKLERSAGKRTLAELSPEGELAITVPSDYIAISAGSVARLYKLRPLSLYAGSINVVIADSAEKKELEGVETVTPGKLLGRPTEWRGRASPRGGFFFAAELLDPKEGTKTAEVLVKATRQAKVLDEMRGVAETLTLVKKSRGAP